MKTALTALTALALTTTAAFAGATKEVSSDLGPVLASSKNGMTLYTFRNDAENTSNCYDSCADAWPPFTAAASAKPEGALTLIKRNDGALQWAMNGQPLYFWQGDSEPGDVTGDGVGGVWDVAKN